MTLEGYAALDPYVPNLWEADDSAWIDQWRQGDIVQPLPLAWVGPAGHDRITGVIAPTEESTVSRDTHLIIDSGRTCVAGIITSQTCDVVTTGPGERHPFVQVSPVLFAAATSLSNLDALRAGRVVDRFLLDPQPSTLQILGGQPSSGHGLLVADLRISLPLSKSILVGQHPLRGFQDEKAGLSFARHLAAKVHRPALHDAVIAAKASVHQALREASKKDTAWWTQVDEVRVQCLPTRLDPTEITFIVVHRTQPTPDTVDRWTSVTKSARKQLKPHDITLRPTLHETVHDLRAINYRSSVALDLPELYRSADE